MSRGITVSRSPELKNGSPLRRYMDLPKFVDLLRTKELYLRRADLFPDRFEGALTSTIRKALNTAARDEKLEETADSFYKRCRRGNFVSCWTFGAKDNMALWQLFGGTTASVAVCTTVMRLTQICINWPESSLISKVQYIDHFENPDMIIGNYTDPLEFKHEAYEFEREVRIMLPQQQNWRKNPAGLRRRIYDLNELVTSIIVAPEAEAWFLEIVGELSNNYGLCAPVKMSQLSALPS